MSTFCDRIREQAGIKNRFYVELQGTSGGINLVVEKRSRCSNSDGNSKPNRL